MMFYALERAGSRGEGNEVLFTFITQACSIINSRVNPLVMRKMQLWENHELNISKVELLAGAGDSLIPKKKIMTYLRRK